MGGVSLMASTFFARTDELKRRVGDGDLSGTVGFDVSYAIPMHEKGWQNFMGRYGPKEIEHYHGGGGEKYLEGPFKERYERYLARLARNTLSGGLTRAMAQAMNDLADEAARRAPFKTGELRENARAQVFDNGHLAYDSGE